MEPAGQKIMKRTLEIFLVVSALILIGVMVWGMDRGFDPTDEGYNLLGLDPAQEKGYIYSALQFVLLSRLFGWLDGVLAYRALSIVITLPAALVFGWGFQRLLGRLYPGRVVLAGWASAAWFVGVSFFFNVSLSLTFSYNIFLNACMLLTGGLLLYSLAILGEAGQRRRLRLAWGGIGLALGLALLVKPTGALGLALLHLASLLLFAPRAWKAALRDGLLPAAAGGVLALLLALALNVIGPLLETLRGGVVLHPGHQLADLLVVLRQDARELFWYLLPFSGLVLGALACGVGFAVWDRLEERLARRGGLLFTLLLGAAASLLFPLVSNALFDRKLRVPLLGTFIVILMLLIAITAPALWKRLRAAQAGQSAAEWRKLLLGAYLLLLPLGTAAGTNNLLQWQLWIHITPWLGLMLVLFQETQLSRWTWYTGWIVLAFVAAWIWSEWLVGYFVWPYRLQAYRSAQSEPVNVRSTRFAGLKVDEKTKTYLEEFDQIVGASQFRAGYGVIGLYDIPGMIYLVEGCSPGDPWFMADIKWAPALLNSVRSSRLAKPTYLIVTNQPLSPTVESFISGPEVNFPDAYRQLGRTQNPVRIRDTTIYERRR